MILVVLSELIVLDQIALLFFIILSLICPTSVEFIKQVCLLKLLKIFK